MEQTQTYTNRPMWQSILIYLLIGGLLYAVVYYGFLAGNKPSDTIMLEEPTPTDTMMQEETAPAVDNEAQLRVMVSPTGFTPNSITIKVGDQVTWENQSGGPVFVASSPHPAHTDYPLLNLQTMQDGGTVSLVFPTTGTFRYHDHLNPTWFGSVTVQ